MPFVKEEANSILDVIKENIDKIKKHCARLTEVRLQKLKKKETTMNDIGLNISFVSSKQFITLNYLGYKNFL